MSTLSTGGAAALRRGLLLGVGVNAALVAAGLALFPTTLTYSRAGPRSTAGAALVLIVYGLVALLAPAACARRNSSILHWATLLGLAAGGIFAVEMVLEYVLLPADNTAYGLVEFGLVFLVFFTAGAIVAWQTRRWRYGVAAAVLTAVIASLIWLAALLVLTYTFKGTDRQVQVFRAEGMYFDFARSGSQDFAAFVMEDFLGAAFFHLLLAPMIAAVLGAVGALVGKGLARLRPPANTG